LVLAVKLDSITDVLALLTGPGSAGLSPCVRLKSEVIFRTLATV